jgi:hypothetical protein
MPVSGPPGPGAPVSGYSRYPVSAGILLYRLTPGGTEVLLAHPGGPFFANQDEGIWGLPKGLADPGEDLLAAARREFTEETGLATAGPFVPLGQVTLRSGKVVHAWACQGEADPRSLRWTAAPGSGCLKRGGASTPRRRLSSTGWRQPCCWRSRRAGVPGRRRRLDFQPF